MKRLPFAGAAAVVVLALGTPGAHARGSQPIPPNILSASFSSVAHVAPGDHRNGPGRSDVTDVEVQVSGVLGQFAGYQGGSGMDPVPRSHAPQIHVKFSRTASADIDVQRAGEEGYAPDPSCPWVSHDQQTGEATGAPAMMRQLAQPKTGMTRYFRIDGDDPRLFASSRDHIHVTYRVYSGDFTLQWLLPMTVHRTADSTSPGTSDTPGGPPGPCQRLSGATDSVAAVSVSVPAQIARNGRIVRLGPAEVSVLSDDQFALSVTVGAARLDSTLTGPVTGNATFARPITNACPKGRPENYGGRLRCPK